MPTSRAVSIMREPCRPLSCTWHTQSVFCNMLDLVRCDRFFFREALLPFQELRYCADSTFGHFKYTQARVWTLFLTASWR